MMPLAPLAVGLAFGFLLHKAGMGRYDVIVNVFRFSDLTVLKFLMSALLVGMLGLQLLSSLDLTQSVPIPQTYWLGNALGGLLFGVGMATAGFCPGTVAAGAGEGRLDYLVAGGAGLYAGALAFGFSYPKLMPWLATQGNLGSVTLPSVLHVNSWLVIALIW